MFLKTKEIPIIGQNHIGLLLPINVSRPMKNIHKLEKIRKAISITITFIMLVLAGIWVVYPDSNIEPAIALLGLFGVVIANIPSIYGHFGIDPTPLGKGVLASGALWLQKNMTKWGMPLKLDINQSKTEIKYRPENEVRAYFFDNEIIFERRDISSNNEIYIDFKLINLE